MVAMVNGSLLNVLCVCVCMCMCVCMCVCVCVSHDQQLHRWVRVLRSVIELNPVAVSCGIV